MRPCWRVFSRLTLRRVMEVESGSERFRVPKTSFQENVLVNDAVPASTNWTLVTKGNWQLLDRIVQNFKMHCFGNWIWCVVFRRFVLFRRCLDAEMKDGVREGLHKKIPGDELIRNESSAKSLLYTVYFYNTKIFGLMLRSTRELSGIVIFTLWKTFRSTRVNNWLYGNWGC